MSAFEHLRQKRWRGVVVSSSTGCLFLGLLLARTLRIPAWVHLEGATAQDLQDLNWALGQPCAHAPVCVVGLNALFGFEQTFQQVLRPAGFDAWLTLMEVNPRT